MNTEDETFRLLKKSPLDRLVVDVLENGLSGLSLVLKKHSWTRDEWDKVCSNDYDRIETVIKRYAANQ